MWLGTPAAGADELAVFQGRVMDIEGNAVTGVSLFVYNSPQVKRPADFISAETAHDGRFRMSLPPGTYWAVARLKKGEKYGPLMPGDKHSGEPEKLELLSGAAVNKDFTVADIREAARLMKKTRNDIVKIQGRIIDDKGMPVHDAYVIAWRDGRISRYPDYLSAWTGEQGSYSLYLPRGKYSFGAATSFPPGRDDSEQRVVPVETDMAGVDVRLDREIGRANAR